MPDEPVKPLSNEERKAAGLPPLPPAGRKVGRPAYKVTPQLCAKVEELAAKGLSRTNIALSLGWGVVTFYKKSAAYPELYDAMIRGEAAAVSAVENAIFINATRPATDAAGNPVGMPGGSVDAQKFWLSRRVPDWKQTDTDTEGGGKKVNVTIVLPDNMRLPAQGAPKVIDAIPQTIRPTELDEN